MKHSKLRIDTVPSNKFGIKGGCDAVTLDNTAHETKCINHSLLELLIYLKAR
jgi:hypothetical protein